MGNKVASIYTFASGKGGTGKTTVSANVATALAGMGKRVLIIDTDLGMANVGLFFSLNINKTLHDVLAGDVDVREAIYEGPYGVKILPAGYTIKGYQKANIKMLETVLDQLNREFDFIIMDTPSGINPNIIIPLKLSHYVMVIMNPEITSKTDSLKTATIARGYDVPISGVVVNRIENGLSQNLREKINESSGVDIIGEIPADIAIQKSLSLQKPVVCNYPTSAASLSLKRIAAQMAGIEISPTYLDETGSQPKKGFFQRIKGIFFAQ
ncbi:cell division ATPase MinD [Methanohalophilus portucalensis]|uniref:Septum site-determining protein MinD n=2 Tax=Methanohalophilus portucalensis FDF-1 TaxID=523843 RepID=A0A1X7NV40_9EURY|nr:cell division ATPase MinD [Methanohalophilus portucalensis]RNI11618.1 septum site-determining protein MinD [Methanohalophilus portucalensis FDF-1]SMH42076.1 septum site-determining protein MinD [Methanohalophilus portucalensis FDF-1]